MASSRTRNGIKDFLTFNSLNKKYVNLRSQIKFKVTIAFLRKNFGKRLQKI